MATSVELYEALKDKLGQRGARMLADTVPIAADVATRADIERLELTVDRKLESLRADFERARAETGRLLLLFFLPLWLGVYGTLAALIVTVVSRA